MSAISSALQSRPSSVSTAQTTAIGGNPVLRSRASDSSAIPDRAVMPPGRSTKGMTWPGVVIAPGQTGSCTAARIVTARSRADIPVETPSQASNEIPTSTSSRGPLRRGSTLRPRAAKRSSCIASETIPRAVPAIWLIIPGETNAAGRHQPDVTVAVFDGNGFRQSKLADASCNAPVGQAALRRAASPQHDCIPA